MNKKHWNLPLLRGNCSSFSVTVVLDYKACSWESPVAHLHKPHCSKSPANTGGCTELSDSCGDVSVTPSTSHCSSRSPRELPQS